MTFKERIVFSVASWKGWQRYTATLIFIFIILGCWWMLSYRHLVQQVQRIRSDVVITVQEPREDTSSLADELQRDAQQFFSITSAHEVIQALIAYAENEHVHVENYVASPLQKQDWYRVLEVTMKLQGDIQDVINFLERVQGHHNILIKACEMLSLTQERVQCSCILFARLP